MIRKFQRSDMEQVMSLWISGNKDAHFFIANEYWLSHSDEVQNALLQANVFVYDEKGKIRGFIGVIQNYIAGCFVDKAFRSSGIGGELLTYVKQKHQVLSLNVYQKNIQATAFYQKEGFSILEEKIDPDTGENEYTMYWEKTL